jgi:hypothetical protein
MLEHEDMKDRLVSLVLGELSEPARSEVRKHATECDLCRTELKRLETLLRCASERKELVADEVTCRSAKANLVAALGSEAQSNETARPDYRRAFERRRIMTFAKLSIAAMVAVVAGLIGLSKLDKPAAQPEGPFGRFTLLAKACAAEETLFAGNSILHIQNEITVRAYATSDPCQAALKNIWLPMASVKADGTLRMDQLNLPARPESYIVTDHSWYDPATGRFARVLKADGKVVFANAYDGRAIYTTEPNIGGGLRIAREAIVAGFIPPSSPAEYLGIAAGLKTSLARNTTMIQDVVEGTLPDGTSAHIYKVGMPDPNGGLDSYWLFKVRDDDSTVAEKEFILLGQSRLLIRRALTESVEAPGVAWDLQGLTGLAGEADAKQPVSVNANMVVPNVSVEHMVQTATFETYVFSVKPSWVENIEITDSIDPATPGERMFILTGRADDHRHVVLVQSPTYNKMLGMVVRMGKQVYASPNGFKVWGGGRDKWLAQVLLQSAQYAIKDPPSEDRTGYILESPAGTFPAIAINGQLSETELHALIDNLIPARQSLARTPDSLQNKRPVP